MSRRVKTWLWVAAVAVALCAGGFALHYQLTRDCCAPMVGP